MNSSLTVPDYLTCSVTLTAPIKSLKRQKRSPTLGQARLVERRGFRQQPMAARIGQFNPAAEGIRRPDIGEDRLHPDDVQYDADGREVERDMAIFNPSLLPDPPMWIARFVSGHLKTLPLSTEDDDLLAWVRSLKDRFLRAAREVKPRTAAAEKKKMTNAERFRLQLPPVAPPAIRNRPNKPAPFRMPGIEYSKEEIDAMGWAQTPPGFESIDEQTQSHSKVWLSVLLAAMDSEKKAEAIRKDVLESIWQLLDFVAAAQEQQVDAMKANKARMDSLQAQADALLPKDVHGPKGFAAPQKAKGAKKEKSNGAKGGVNQKGPLQAQKQRPEKAKKKDAEKPVLQLQRAKPNLADDQREQSNLRQKGTQDPEKVPDEESERDEGPFVKPNGQIAGGAEQPDSPALDARPAQLDKGVLTGLRSMLDAKEKELSELREQIEALGKQWRNIVPIKVGSNPAELVQGGEAQEAFSPEQDSLDPFEEHIRLAKAKQAEAKAQKVQPELSLLESEDFLAGAAAIDAGKGKRLPGGVQFVKPGPRK